jgi:AcrR family transcriptional regulator
MPRTKKQYDEIKKKKRAIILQAALEVFAEKSFLGTSVSSIAKKAGVSKGLLYSYFESKDDLLKQIIFEGVDELIAVFDINNDGVLTQKEFIYFIEATFVLLEKDTHFWKLYFSIIVQPAVMALVQDKFLEILTPMLKILIEYYQNRGVKNPIAHARLLGAVLDGVFFNYIIDPVGFPIDDIKKLIIEKIV